MQARMERNWMTFLAISLVLFGINSDRTWAEDDRHRLLSPSALKMFVDELPDMPRISAFHVLDGVSLPKSLKIGMFHKKWKFHRDLPPTPVFAYGTSKTAATVPGPTIEALHGVDTYVTWKNHLPSKHILPWDPTIPTAMPRTKRGIPTVVHLHGGIDEPESDGHAYSWFTAGFKERGPSWTKKKYHYHNNQQPGNLWYHDHAMGLTRVNLLAGLIGSYIIRHHAVEAPLGLPNGAEFDRPLVVFDRSFRTDGSIYMNATGNNPSIHPQWQPEYFGDAIIVNGKAWPHMIVKRRKYRFRIINASNARFFKFYFTNGLGFIHVASDSAYNERPVKTNSVLVAPSEIADVVVDFSKSKSDRAILGNDAAYPYPSGDPVNEVNGKVMKFIIKPHRENDTSVVPNKLVKYPSSSAAAAWMARRYIGLYEYASAIDEPINLKINGKTFEAPATEKPKVGATEIWYVINLTEDNHPLHIHLGLFRVLEQTELLRAEEFKACMTKVNDAVKCQIRKYARGKKLAVVAHEKGWKNVYKMRPGYVTKILLRFSYIHTNASYPFDATANPGYVYHCHVLNAAMLYWPMPNVLYVEGYALDRFAEGLWALQPVHQNRVGLVLDGGIEQELLVRHLQVVDATRASLGLPVVEYVVTDTPLQVEKWVDQKSQQSTGRIKHPDSLLRAVQTLIDRSMVNAIAVVARFPDDDTEDIDDYRQGMGIDHLAGAEAVISHLVVKNFGIPCAHAPALSPLSLSMSLCPKSAAEEIGYTFLPCVLAGLSNAPQYMVNKSESLERGCILATDVDSVILPLDACGGDGALAFASLKRNKPLIITVEENETVLNDSADKLGIEAVKVSNYWEAIGVVAAHKAGVNPNSLRRNRIKNIRQTSSVTSNGYAVSTAR